MNVHELDLGGKKKKKNRKSHPILKWLMSKCEVSGIGACTDDSFTLLAEE